MGPSPTAAQDVGGAGGGAGEVGGEVAAQVPHLPRFFSGFLEHWHRMADTRAHFLRSFFPCTASQASLAAAQRATLPPHRQRSDFLHGFFGRGAHSSAAAPRGAGAEGWASAPPGVAAGRPAEP